MGKHYNYPQYFINTIGELTARQVGGTTASFVNAIAPVGGAGSVKVKTLNAMLGGNLGAIVAGTGSFSGFGRTARARVLKAFKLRQNGTFFG